MLSRRKFLTAPLGFILGGARVMRPEPVDLPPIPRVRREGRKKIAVIYSAINTEAVANLFKGLTAGSGAAAGSIAGNLLYDRMGKITRREFMEALPDLVASGAMAGLSEEMARFHEDLVSEIRALRQLHEDLEAKGYQVHSTTSGTQFVHLLEKAAQRRPKDAQTAVFVEAHGAGDPQEFELETNEEIKGSDQTFRIHSQTLARLLSEIPGHSLLALGSCHAHSKAFKAPDFRGRLTLLSNTAGSWRNEGYGSMPFFKSVRLALRQNGDLADNAEKAYGQSHPSWFTRRMAGWAGAGIKAERINHDKPFNP